MKRERTFSWLWGTALSFGLAWGIAGCLATAFEFTLTDHFLIAMAVLCPLIAGLCCFRFGELAGLALLAGGSVYLWQRGSLSAELDALVYAITKCYRSGYGWPVITWTEQQNPELTVTLPFILIGAFIALVTARAVIQRGRSFWVILAAAPYFALCVVLIDTVPAAVYLQMVLFTLVMLLMTQTLRRRDAQQGNRLAAMLTLPLAIAIAVLFHAVPREGYTPPPEDLAQRTVAWFQQQELGTELAEQVLNLFVSRRSEKVDLKNSGPRGSQKYKVMEVSAESTGQLYLRGKAYDVYNGKQWIASEGEWALDGDYVTRGSYLGYVTVQTNAIHDVMYVPGMPNQSICDRFAAGFIANTEELKEYTLPWFIQPSGHLSTMPSYLSSTDGSGDTDIRSGAENLMQVLAGQYLQLPENTREAAEHYLRENIANTVKLKKNPNFKNEIITYQIAGKSYALPAGAAGDVILEAAIIRELVQNSAAYDLKTHRMPLGESDFAMWFLNSSDTGYCVHFATAATVLLRAAGIPARYVEGYLVGAEEDGTVTVRGEDAHAWVEYWVPGRGWQLLEATPGQGTGTSTEATEPEETTAPTTLPNETEAPTTEATRPDIPTRPDMTRPPISDGEVTSPTEGGTPMLPGSDGGNGGRPVVDLSWLVAVIKWLALTSLALGALWGQWKLRLALRRRWLSQGSSNQRALRHWRVLSGMWKHLKIPPDPELEELALKARFSQYALSLEELDKFLLARANAIALMRRSGWHRQMLYRLVLALY